MMTAEGTLDEFCEHYSTATIWIANGWSILPKVNGAGYRDFETLCSSVKNVHGYLNNDSGDWYGHAAEIENQEIIRLYKRFKGGLLECDKLDDIDAMWNTRGNGKKKVGHVRRIENKFDELMPSYAVSFHIDHLCSWSVPKSLKFSSVAGIYCMGRWFTEAHIEVNGDDSISAVPIGKKVFIYAAGITASRWLLKTIVDIPSFMALAKQGPPQKWRGKLFVCIPGANSVIAQPSFWAHAVLTVKGPALVMGWEAGIQENSQRLETVLCQYSFARGMGIGAQNAIRQMATDEQDKILPLLPGDAGECMRTQAEAGLLVPGPAKRSRKKKRYEHLPGPKKIKKENCKSSKVGDKFFFVTERIRKIWFFSSFAGKI